MRQVSEWLDFYRSEPWGYEVADTRNAMLALVTARSAGSKDAKLEHFRLRPQAEAAADAGDVDLAAQVRRVFNLPKGG